MYKPLQYFCKIRQRRKVNSELYVSVYAWATNLRQALTRSTNVSASREAESTYIHFLVRILFVCNSVILKIKCLKYNTFMLNGGGTKGSKTIVFHLIEMTGNIF